MFLRLKQYENIYFLGIGGVGMSGLAGWCNMKKYNVAGYDREENHYTLKLKFNGLYIHHNVSKEEIPIDFLNNKITLIVYTPAIQKNHLLYKFFLNQNFTIIKRAKLLSHICLDYNVIAIAGTHGKTTISIMLSHLLLNAGYNPNAFFGGIYKNNDTNFLVGDSKYMIVEADEYDQSFLDLEPAISLITSLDKDHVDTYDSEDDMVQSYYQFLLNTCNSSINNSRVFSDCNQIQNNLIFMPAEVKKKFLQFLSKKRENYSDIEQASVCESSQIKKEINLNLSCLQNFCDHNIKNALLASKIASVIGLSNSEIERGFKTFLGVKRRFEYHIKSENLILIDDYAHHPKELFVLIKSIQKLYPKRKLFLIFQPHLFSRTQDLEDDFCNVLSLVDQLVLLDIYPAREDPIEGVDSKNLLKKIQIKQKWNVDFHSIKLILQELSPDLIVTAGAGDIYKLIPIIKKTLL